MAEDAPFRGVGHGNRDGAGVRDHRSPGVPRHHQAISTSSTPLNSFLFVIMGMAIAAQTFISIAVAVAFWRQKFKDPAMGWALRLGMIITIVGALIAGFMTHPTAAQLAAAHAGQGMPIMGAHTVGAPDGGPGLPGTGWALSTATCGSLIS